MEWLSQNWIWLALGIGAVFMMTRGARGGGGCCSGDTGHDQGKAEAPDTLDAGESSARRRHA